MHMNPRESGLVEYAADRGVRIVPEFDMPGHGGWAYGMPELCLTSCTHVLAFAEAPE